MNQICLADIFGHEKRNFNTFGTADSEEFKLIPLERVLCLAKTSRKEHQIVSIAETFHLFAEGAKRW